jgi:predicted PolB exonuclease-like 3'-5' exonuclease
MTGNAARPTEHSAAEGQWPAYLAFDVESIADGELVKRIRYPGESLAAVEAVRRYRDELMARYENDFVPYSFQYPVSIVVAKIAADFRLLDLVALDEPQFRPHVMTENFWRGWEAYQRPTLVSFNGRSFDLPLLELAAFRFGIRIAGWMDMGGPNYQQPRYRYNTAAHLDLHDVLTNHGATRFSGGLNLAAALLGKPGKMDVQGHMVQDLYDAGDLAAINDYCRCDVLDTYFVFLRTAVLLGTLTLDREQSIVAETRHWLTERAAGSAAYRAYLSRWGDWPNPWAPDDRASPDR